MTLVVINTRTMFMKMTTRMARVLTILTMTLATSGMLIVNYCQMIKINKFKKQTDRLLVVSEKKLYKVDAAKIKVINIDHHEE